MVQANNLGYPRIGRNRELKRATEGFWSGKVSEKELLTTAATIREENWKTQWENGIELIPSNDFSLYDQVLDTIAMVGAVPPRFHWDGVTVDLQTYFAMARGGPDVTPLEMTKWFDTNYHYLVPEFVPEMGFRLASTKPFNEYEQAQSIGIETKPVLIGPVSFLLLGKSKVDGFDPLTLLDALLPVYREVIAGLASRGAHWIQLDEPCFVLDQDDRTRAALRRAYEDLSQCRATVNLLVQTYFGHVAGNYEALTSLPVQGIGLDLVRGRETNLALLQEHGFPDDRALAAGVVDGRNVWITDLAATVDLLSSLPVSHDRLFVNPSCSLMHVPIDVQAEQGVLDERLMSWLAFAQQKVGEVGTLAAAVLEGPESVRGELDLNAQALQERRTSQWVHKSEVEERMAAVDDELASRGVPFEERHTVQQEELNLPPYPTTTIGSFPQTPEVRRNRNRFQKGDISREQHDRFIEEEIRRTIALQEEMGLDVLVHGEFERSDMVEYFGERMDGFAFTRHGWVQSYGSRYIRPPIIYGDVSRPEPMTVRWSTYAQSLTDRPVKGMLTGPVTILNWSFPRDDQPRRDTCLQIALAIRDEVRDLEDAGIRIIQVDEPALREGLPLRRAAWEEYLRWAITCFRVATSVAGPGTQIHTHMCYSEFGDIIDAIAALDADVISIENSRSDLELLDVFRRFDYRQDIGPGVYDIHSPRVPSAQEMRQNLEASSEVLRAGQLWVNPDCGLKTRRWEEVEPALHNMVEAARAMRSTEARQTAAAGADRG